MVHMNVMPRTNEHGFARVRTAIARVLPARRNDHTVGIEIASDAVRMCHVHRRKGVSKVDQLTSMPLPPEAIVDGAIMNPEPIVIALRACHAELVANGMQKRTRAVIGVSGHSVIIKRISLPEMTDEELAESMLWEAEQYIPFDINDVYMDAAVLQRHWQGEMDILLVAVKRDLVAEYVDCVAAALGTAPTVVDMNVLAIERAFSAYHVVPAGETEVLVDVGDAMMSIHILANGQLKFTRDISMGRDLFIEEVQQQLNVSRDEAEALFREYSAALAPIQGAETDAVANGIRTILTGVADTLAEELQRSLDFYSATTVDGHPSRLYLSGTVATTVQLQRMIEQRSGLPVKVETFGGQLDGVLPIHLDGAHPAAWAIPVGLALHDGRRSLDHSTLAPVAQPEHIVGHIPAVHGPHPTIASPKYRASPQELARCFETLALLLATGVPVLDALTVVQQDGRTGKRMRRCLGIIRDRIVEGASIGPAFVAVVNAPVVTHALTAGEANARLVETLHACAQYLTTGTATLLPAAPGNPPHLHAVGDDE